MTFPFEYRATERVHIAADAGTQLGQELLRDGFQHPLMIVSSTLHSRTDAISSIKDKVQNTVKGSSVEILDGIAAHSPVEDVFKIVDKAREMNADVLVTVGGGSIMDATKVAQAILSDDIGTKEELDEYALVLGKGSTPPTKFLSNPTIRQIAIPTTIAAAEHTGVGGVTDTASGRKMAVISNQLCPVAVILDPNLVRHTPDDLWYSTGIRALDHAVEGFLCPFAPAIIKQEMLGAMTLLSGALRDLKQGKMDETDCRSRAQQGAWLASESLARVPSGASHGLGYIAGAKYGVPHGFTSCIFLPAVVEWNNLDRAIDAQIAQALGSPETSAAEAIRNLVSELGLPGSLSSVGVEQSHWSEIADEALDHPIVKANCRPIETESQVYEILRICA